MLYVNSYDNGTGSAFEYDVELFTEIADLDEVYYLTYDSFQDKFHLTYSEASGDIYVLAFELDIAGTNITTLGPALLLGNGISDVATSAVNNRVLVVRWNDPAVEMFTHDNTTGYTSNSVSSELADNYWPQIVYSSVYYTPE